MKAVFITGIHSGIGQELARTYIALGYSVYAVGKREDKRLSASPDFYFLPYDFREPDLLRSEITVFTNGLHFERVILNAAHAPELSLMDDTLLETMRETMNTNLWANKQILDALLRHADTEQVIALGADPALFRHRGWGAYAVSKAALEALMAVYADETPGIHFSTIAPYLTQTPMLKRVFEQSDRRRFPSIRAIESRIVLTPEQSVAKLLMGFEKVKELPSGIAVTMEKLDR